MVSLFYFCSMKLFLIYYNYVKSPTPLIVVTENLLACQNLYNKLSVMLKDKVYMYCVDEIIKYSTLAISPELSSSRIFVLDKLLNNEPIIVITHTLATKRLVPSPSMFKKSSFELIVDAETNVKDIVNKLIKIKIYNVEMIGM